MSSLRNRPESGKYTFSSGKRNTSMRSQLKEDSKLTYTQGSNSKPLYSLTTINVPELRRLMPKRTNMSPQRIFEQNMALKKRINQLSEELRLERAKGETVERRNAKWKKKLDIQFEKQLYWGQKGEYMVMGVKNQYDKIKKMYDDKCKQNHDIRKDLKYTEMQEVKAELQVYREEVGRLKQELDKFIDVYKVPYDIRGNDEQSSRLLIIDMKEALARLEYESITYKSGIKSMDKLIKDRDEKIDFLQKLVVDKDNHSHQLQQSSRRLQHENENVKAKNKQLKQQIEEEKESINHRIQDIKNTEERKFERETSIYQNQLQIKNQKITKLDAEIVYLSTLLAQWRPSQNDSFRNSLEHKHQEVRPSTVMRKESDLVLSIHEAQDLNRDKNFHQISRTSIDQNLMMQSNVSKKQKNTHYTLKRDKVRKDEIQNICLQIKFRLLNKKVNLIQAKTYIRSPQGQTISIQNLLDIFSQQPFCIESSERRILLARYLIQDVYESTIYYDQERSQPEVIVRSIFEQIIPKFTIPSEAQQSTIRAKVVEMLSKYHVTLGQVVSQYNRQMILNQKKLTQILDEQELNMGQQYNDYMISHMLKTSPDITQMNFKALLTLVPSKEN